MPRRTGKRNLFDWATLGQYDNADIIGVCLTQREVMILKSALIPAYWSRRWMGLPDTLLAADELAAMISKIDSQLDGNDCPECNMQFRDNPLDGCEVQYSNDSGVTWITMFRKDNCISVGPSNITTITTAITNIISNNTLWDNDIVNVAPQWEYVDQWSDRAICWAIDAFVDAVCAICIQEIKSGNVQKRNENAWLENVQEALSIAVVAMIGLLPTAPVTLPAAAVTFVAWASVTLVEWAWDELVSEDYSDYEDEEAKQTIKCVMYDNMKGGTPQFEVWETSMVAYDNMCGAGHAIGRMLWKWCSDVDVYINYLLLVESINSISEALPECPCPDRWEHFWDFANVGAGTWAVCGSYGHYEEGVGFVGDMRLQGGLFSNIIEELMLISEIPTYVPRCDGFRIHIDAVKGTFDYNSKWLCMRQPPNPEYTQGQGSLFTGVTSWRHNFPLGTLERAEINFARSCATAGGNWGSMVITGITLYGEGTDPFSGCDN